MLELSNRLDSPRDHTHNPLSGFSCAVDMNSIIGISIWNTQPITLLNMYGPCSDRKLFWDRVADSSLLDCTDMIIVGGLNFTTNSGEVCGSSTTLDPLAGYITTLLQIHHLVDFLLNAIVPTWRNGSSGLEAISKRLDRFLLTEDLALQVGRIKTWVDYPYFSDHASILLHLDPLSSPKSHPFKFNSSWLL